MLIVSIVVLATSDLLALGAIVFGFAFFVGLASFVGSSCVFGFAFVVSFSCIFGFVFVVGLASRP